MRILVTGDREWVNHDIVHSALSKLPPGSVVIHGAARGLDTIAATCALELGLSIDRPPDATHPLGGYPYPSMLGRAGGPVRNTWMLRDGRPDEVWAFHDALWSKSRGTKDMVNQAMVACVSVVLFSTIAPPTSLIHTLPFEDLGSVNLNQEDMDKIKALNLPNHPGTCNCRACNDAYGVRKQA